MTSQAKMRDLNAKNFILKSPNLLLKIGCPTNLIELWGFEAYFSEQNFVTVDQVKEQLLTNKSYIHEVNFLVHFLPPPGAELEGGKRGFLRPGGGWGGIYPPIEDLGGG